MSDRSDGKTTTLKRECEVFCQYLIDAEPTEYVLQKYEDAHKLSSSNRAVKLELFDRTLLTIARIGPLATRLVDGYAALFFGNSSVRRKLILLLAILESCAPFHSRLDTIDEGPSAIIAARTVRRVCASGFLLLIAVVTLVPLHALASMVETVFETNLWKKF